MNLRFKKIYIGLILLPLIIFLSYPRTISELKKDPFSMWMNKGVIELVEIYPNNKFSLYTCSVKYSSIYNSSGFSALLLLDLRNKVSDEGIKIGLRGDCEYPKNSKGDSFVYPILSSSGMVDFSTASSSAILEAGWSPLTFSRMYDQYARWWFELQP